MMKSLKISLFVLLLFPLGVSAQQVVFYDGSAFDALKVAQSSDKLLLVEFYAQWNRKSCYMHDIIQKSDVLSDDFIVVSVDTSTEDGSLLAQQYSVTEYPFLVVFDSKGDAIEKIGTSLNSADFASKIDEITLSQDKDVLWQLQTIVRAASSPSLTQEDVYRVEMLAKNYLDTHSTEQLTGQSHWSLFASPVLTYYGSDCYRFLVENYESFYDPSLAEEKIVDIVYSILLPLLGGEGNPKMLEAIKNDTTALQIAPCAAQLCELIEIRENNDAKSYTSLMQELEGKIPQKYEYQLFITLSFVAENTTSEDRKTRAKARSMLEKLQQQSLSRAKISLIESLLQEF